MLEMHSFTFKFQALLCRVRDTAPIAARSEGVFFIQSVINKGEAKGKGKAVPLGQAQGVPGS